MPHENSKLNNINTSELQVKWQFWAVFIFLEAFWLTEFILLFSPHILFIFLLIDFLFPYRYIHLTYLWTSFFVGDLFFTVYTQIRNIFRIKVPSTLTGEIWKTIKIVVDEYCVRYGDLDTFVRVFYRSGSCTGTWRNSYNKYEQHFILNMCTSSGFGSWTLELWVLWVYKIPSGSLP